VPSHNPLQPSGLAAFEDDEAHFRNIFESAAVGMALVALDGRWLRVNQSLCEIVGRSESELLGLRFQDITHRDDLEMDLAQVRRLLAGEIRSYNMEKRYIHKTGHVVWILLTASVVPDADGSPLHFIAQIQDIRERKQAEAALRDSEERLRSLVDHNLDAVISMDLQGRLVGLNAAAETLTGYPSAELLGQPFSPYILPEHLELAVEHFRRAVEGTPQSYEVSLLHKSGRRVDVVANNVPIVVEGHVVGVFGVMRDVTEQRALQDQLRQAQKMEAVGRLAGGIAHDFNNLLTAILSNAELVLGELADGPVRHDVELIRQTAERAAALTRQLLAFSRKQVIQPRLVDLNAVVHETDRLLRRSLGEGITLETDLGDIASVLADPGQLEQVLINLAVNARDAMPDGGTLTIRTRDVVVDEMFALRHRGLRPGLYVTFAVEDTGLGMDPQTQARIFEPFFTTKELGRGTGLGLSTVYGIVKQWGGYVSVESALTHGTAFTIYLPRQEGVAEPLEQRVAGRLPGGDETILLVEDEASVRGSIRRILTRQGYSVLEARHGADALQIVDETVGPIALVLTDLMMPEMNGRELIAELQRRPSAPAILAMSGYDEQAAVRGKPLPPETTFLEKPFTVEGLLQAVRTVLDKAARP
jgi:two-component system, cell cycle sensor histidine kinase and response regulator CckA